MTTYIEWISQYLLFTELKKRRNTLLFKVLNQHLFGSHWRKTITSEVNSRQKVERKKLFQSVVGRQDWSDCL